MIALLSWRVWAAVAIAVALAASHWKAYTSGKKSVQVEFDMYVSEQKANMLDAEQKARATEQQITAKLTKATNDYNALKKRNSSSAVAAAGQLQQLEAAVANSPSPDTAATSGTDGPSPYQELFLACSRTLTAVAAEADGIAERLSGLQNYVTSIQVEQK